MPEVKPYYVAFQHILASRVDALEYCGFSVTQNFGALSLHSDFVVAVASRLELADYILETDAEMNVTRRRGSKPYNVNFVCDVR